MHGRFLIILAILIALLGASAVIVYKVKTASKFYVFTYDCNPKAPQSEECLMQKYANLTRKDGVKVAFAKLKADYNTNETVRNNCHEMTHAIGREALIHYKTIQAAFANGDGFCTDGYYHGVIETVVLSISKNKLNATLPHVCDNLVKIDKANTTAANCAHGTGHAIMDIDNGNIFASLKECDKLIVDPGSCYDGVFMENVLLGMRNSGNNPPYFRGSSDPMYPCDKVATKYRYSCYNSQVSYALTVTSNNFSKVFNLCAQQGSAYKDMCYQDLGPFAAIRSNSGAPSFDINTTKGNCLLGPDVDAQTECMDGVVNLSIAQLESTNWANKFCAAMPASMQSNCYNDIRSYAESKGISN